jgi:hypothetical protein
MISSSQLDPLFGAQSLTDARNEEKNSPAVPELGSRCHLGP